MEYLTWDRVLKTLDIDNEELRDLIVSSELAMHSSPIGSWDGEYQKISGEALADRDGLLGINQWPASLGEIKRGYRFLKKDVQRIESYERMKVAWLKILRRPSDRSVKQVTITSKGDAAMLQAKESRELGQLRGEKAKWDDSVKASVLASEFCREFYTKNGRALTSREFEDLLFENGFKSLPYTTQRKIWKAIPQKYRQTGGRPPKAK